MSSTISISNTRKITARRKNREENGMRADFVGSNPHSNGEIFSRSFEDFIEMIVLRITRIMGIMMPRIISEDKIFI